MVGFPFLGGFSSKVNFAMAAMGAGDLRMTLTLIVLAISTFLNTVYFIKTVITLYRKPLDNVVYPVEKGRRGFCFNAALIGFSALNVVLGLFSQPLIQIITAGLATFG